jgi:hypothetical protein
MESETGLAAVSELGALIGYFEGIGFLVKQNLINVDYVMDVFALTISLVWQKWEPLVREERKAWNLPFHKNFEYLAQELQHRLQLSSRP